MVKLLTRQEVIDCWGKNDKYLNFYVCPSCRDILTKLSDGKLLCGNVDCRNEKIYDNPLEGETK